MWTYVKILLLCACAVSAGTLDEGLDRGALEDSFNKILDEMRSHLKLLHVKYFSFVTGEQEYGK